MLKAKAAVIGFLHNDTMFKKPKYSLSEEDSRSLLRDQRITPEEPGTILRDVAALLEAIGLEGVSTSSKQGNLPSGMLPDLNTRLHDPIKLELKRPLLRDYPNLAGPYILLRVLGLVRSERSRVCVDEARLARWQALNPCEQYFALLKTWLFDAKGEVLGEQSREHGAPCTGALLFLTQAFGKGWTRFEDSIHVYGFSAMGAVPAWSTQLMMRLGLIELKARPTQQRSRYTTSKGWIMGKARRTEWGEAVTRAIVDQATAMQDTTDFSFWLDLPEMDHALILQGAFAPFFSEYRNTFDSPEAEVRRGAYVFKAKYHKHYGPGDVWRELAVPHGTTLHDLHHAVLDAFQFWDDEHLYEWTAKDRSGRTRSFVHPACEWCPEIDGYADAVKVGALDLPERGTLNFTFDYGNTWRFVLKLQRIDPPVPELRLIASHGKSLPQ